MRTAPIAMPAFAPVERPDEEAEGAPDAEFVGVDVAERAAFEVVDVPLVCEAVGLVLLPELAVVCEVADVDDVVVPVESTNTIPEILKGRESE